MRVGEEGLVGQRRTKGREVRRTGFGAPKNRAQCALPFRSDCPDLAGSLFKIVLACYHFHHYQLALSTPVHLPSAQF